MDLLIYNPMYPLGKEYKYIAGGGSNRMMPPLDIGWIGKLIENNLSIEFDVIDANINRYDVDHLKKYIKKNKPKIILTTDELYEAHLCMSLIDEYVSIHKKIISSIREIDESANIILIGPHGTSLPDHVFEMSPGLNFIVRGESEYSSMELIEALISGNHYSEIKGISYRVADKIIHNKDREYIQDLDKLGMPAYKLLEMEKYLKYREDGGGKRKTIVKSSRGCPYKCTYCFLSMVGNKFRSRSAENIMSEIDLLVRDYHIDHVSFIDEIFTVDKQRVIDISQMLQDRNYSITWDCETRIETISKPLLDEMAKGGCVEILYGVESLVDDVQKNIKKKINLTKVKDLTNYAESIGIYCYSGLQYGLPGDSVETIDGNIKALDSLSITMAAPLVSRVYPGTELYDQGKREGLIKEGTFQECAESSGLIGNKISDRKRYYQELNLYHTKMRKLSKKRKWKKRIKNIIEKLA